MRCAAGGKAKPEQRQEGGREPRQIERPSACLHRSTLEPNPPARPGHRGQPETDLEQATSTPRRASRSEEVQGWEKKKHSHGAVGTDRSTKEAPVPAQGPGRPGVCSG